MNFPLPSTGEQRSRGEGVARLPGLNSLQGPSFHQHSDTMLDSGTSPTRHHHHRGYSDLTAIINPTPNSSSSTSGSAQAILPPIWNYHGNGLGQNHALPHIQDGRGNGNGPSVQRSYQEPLPQWDHIATHTHSHSQSNGSSHSQLHDSGQKSPPLYGVATTTSSLFSNSAGFYDSRVERISRDNCKSTPPISPIKPLSWGTSYGNDDSMLSTGRGSDRLLPPPASPGYSPKGGMSLSPTMRPSPNMSPNMNHQSTNGMNANSPKSGPARSRARNTPRSLYLPYSDALVREKLPADRLYAFDVAIAFRNNHPGELIPNDLLNELLEEVEQGMFVCFCCPKNRKGRTITPARDHVRKALGNFPFKCVNTWCQHSSLRQADMNKHIRTCAPPSSPSSLQFSGSNISNI